MKHELTAVASTRVEILTNAGNICGLNGQLIILSHILFLRYFFSPSLHGCN